MKLPVHFDMETSDPDDVMTLAILASHPKCNLLSVSVTPGGKDQIGLIKHILNVIGLNIPVGAGIPKPDKLYVSDFHYKWFGKIKDCDADGLAEDIIQSSLFKDKGLCLLTGARLTNISNYIRKYNEPISLIAIQGGFAGDSVVPKEYRLEKFDGKETCPTFNLNGDIQAAFDVLDSKRIIKKLMISKNVCHGITWGQDFHEKVRSVPKTPGLDLVFNGMELYLQKHKDGKKLHDPFAACCLLNHKCAEWREVEVYRHKGEWGSRLVNDCIDPTMDRMDPIMITIKSNEVEFFKTITEV